MAKKESLKREKKSLETKRGIWTFHIYQIIAFVGLIGGLFFISSNITGNVIGTVPGTDILGMVFLTVGLFGLYMFVKKHKKTL